MANAKVGDVVQLDPTSVPEGWEGALLQVTRSAPWGVQGFAQIPDSGAAFFRALHGEYTVVGRAAWEKEDGIWRERGQKEEDGSST